MYALILHKLFMYICIINTPKMYLSCKDKPTNIIKSITKKSNNMENWKEKIKFGDITRAAERSGLKPNVYYASCRISVDQWTPSMVDINAALKNMIEEREKNRAEFLSNTP